MTYQPTRAAAQAEAAGFFPPRHPAYITANEELAPDVMRMTFVDPYVAKHAKPSQFVDLFPADPMKPMPRPLGVAEVHGDEVSVMYAVVGKGTADFSRLVPGDSVDLLGPLGRGFNVKKPAHYLLVAGGLGVPPLIFTAQKLAAVPESRSTALFGYRDVKFADRYVEPFSDRTMSIDNEHGNVVTLLDQLEAEGGLQRDGLDPVILTCGPLPMMKAVAHWAAERGIGCQASMEQRMGCGYGTCVLCTVDTAEGRLKVCADGPVFTREQLGWQ